VSWGFGDFHDFGEVIEGSVGVNFCCAECVWRLKIGRAWRRPVWVGGAELRSFWGVGDGGRERLARDWKID
jgi:hypothetical protein